MKERERIEREARDVLLALGARTTPMLDALTKAPAATHYALGGDFDKAIASVTALVLRERAAAWEKAAEHVEAGASSAMRGDVHWSARAVGQFKLDTGNQFRARAAQEQQ